MTDEKKDDAQFEPSPDEGGLVDEERSGPEEVALGRSPFEAQPVVDIHPPRPPKRRGEVIGGEDPGRGEGAGQGETSDQREGISWSGGAGWGEAEKARGE